MRSREIDFAGTFLTPIASSSCSLTNVRGNGEKVEILRRILFSRERRNGKVFFQLRINANLREENFKSPSRKARSREKSVCGEKFFWETRVERAA